MAKEKKNNVNVKRREIDLLNKYYEIDNEKRIVTMPLHYDKASDLINNKIVSKDNYLFDYDELSSINDMIKRVPVMYKIHIDIQIDDYEDYEPNKLLSGFNDAMELNQFNYERENRLKFLKAGLLLLVGVSILFFIGYAKINGLFGSSERASIYTEIFDIIGWVFIWEMVTVAFLSPSELTVNSNMFRLRVRNVRLLDIEYNELAKESLTEIASKWESERRLEKASRWSLLISGVAFIAVAIIGLIDVTTSTYSLIENLSGAEEGTTTSSIIGGFIIIELLALALSFIEMFGGIIALFRYAGKRKFIVVGNILSVVLLVLIGLTIGFNISDSISLVRSSVSFIIMILYVFGIISNSVLYNFNDKRKKDNKKVNDKPNTDDNVQE